MKLRNLVYSAIIIFLAGCAPELTEQDVQEAYKGHEVPKPIVLEKHEVYRQWEASIQFKCGDEICMSTLIHENGKWRVR